MIVAGDRRWIEFDMATILCGEIAESYPLLPRFYREYDETHGSD